MNNYTIIDFETAGRKRATACSLGMVRIEGNKIVSKFHRLLKPECFPNFDPMNVMIHGITPSDVENEPEFIDLWLEIKPWLEDQIVVAHNTSFDISVLLRTLDLYQIEIPKFNYLCSYRLAKSSLPNLPYYSLDYLANHFGINFRHHDALEDCIATSEILKLLMDEIDENILESNIKESVIFGKKISSAKRVSDIVAEEGLIDENSPFFGKEVIFTGALTSMARLDAQQMVANIGGIVGKSLNSRTAFLVIGQQDFKVVGESGRSGKQKKAEELSKKGQIIEILSEQEFLNYFDN